MVLSKLMDWKLCWQLVCSRFVRSFRRSQHSGSFRSVAGPKPSIAPFNTDACVPSRFDRVAYTVVVASRWRVYDSIYGGPVATMARNGRRFYVQSGHDFSLQSLFVFRPSTTPSPFGNNRTLYCYFTLRVCGAYIARCVRPSGRRTTSRALWTRRDAQSPWISYAVGWGGGKSRRHLKWHWQLRRVLYYRVMFSRAAKTPKWIISSTRPVEMSKNSRFPRKEPFKKPNRQMFDSTRVNSLRRNYAINRYT